MTSRYYDFDAAASEPEPITIHLLGRDWTLPATTPAAPLLAYERMLLALQEHEQSGTDTPFVVEGNFSVEHLARQFAGDEAVDGWLAAGLDYPGLQRAVRLLRTIRMGRDPHLGESPPPAPPRGAKAGQSPSETSSPAGQR